MSPVELVAYLGLVALVFEVVVIWLDRLKPV